MPELLAYLERFLARDRAQVILDNAAADAARTAGYLENNLGVRMHAYDLDLGELEQRIAAVREQLDTSKRKLDELHVRIEADAASIKNQIALDLEAFARAFVAALPAQIDAVDANDVKLYLPAFIEDKFKEWAELEGAQARGDAGAPRRAGHLDHQRERRGSPRRRWPSGSGPRTPRSRSRSTASSTTSGSTRWARSAPP